MAPSPVTGSVSAIVLAAGAGTRMRSTRPKPIHVLCGRPMLAYVLDALTGVPLHRAVIVVGAGAAQVTKRLEADGPSHLLEFVEQTERRGTGDAVAVGLSAFADDVLDDEADLVVLPGDTPLLTAATVTALVDEHRASGAACTVLTTVLDDPSGYGRVVRGQDGDVARIVEQADATGEEQAITEVNTSIYCFRRSLLAPALRRVSPENAQGEIYLTDVVEVLRDAGHPVASVVVPDAEEAAGVNDRAQLAGAEAVLRRRTAHRLMGEGVTMVDPDRTYVDTTVEVGTDVTLFPGTLLQGRTVVGAGSEIGPDSRLEECTVGDGCVVQHTVGRDATVGDGAVVGPFAYLEPGCVVDPGVRTGPFYTSAPLADDPER